MPLTPDQVIAKDNFAAYKLANYPAMSEDDAFERFVVSQIALRRHNMGASEVDSGLVGGRDDGGIDGFYIFVNGQELVESDSTRLTRRKNALDGLQPGMTLDVVIVQAKKETSWDTNVFGGFQLTLQHQRGIGGCDAGQETDAGGRGSGGEAAAVCAADCAGGQ